MAKKKKRVRQSDMFSLSLLPPVVPQTIKGIELLFFFLDGALERSPRVHR